MREEGLICMQSCKNITEKNSTESKVQMMLNFFFFFLEKDNSAEWGRCSQSHFYLGSCSPYLSPKRGKKKPSSFKLAFVSNPQVRIQFFYTKSWLCLYFFKSKGCNYCRVKHQKWLMLCIFASYTFSKNWSYSSCPQLPFHSFIRFFASPFMRRKN